MKQFPPPTNESTEEPSDLPFSSPPPPDVAYSHRIVRHSIQQDVLDMDAIKVVRRLSRFGYKAYLVGGCVRDILFGLKPKDFDITTSALPAEMRRLFRNCRIIGRRFRLAHLLFKKNKIIEVATFRRSATEDDDITGRHAAENLFGGPADDAIRRDFTINALMYDAGRREIHDYVGGLEDIDARILRAIGDPDRRLPEDPVRIIRAVKFSVRLDLKIEPTLFDAMKRHAGLIVECAPARLVEEIFKLLRSGTSARCFAVLNEIGVLEVLLPDLVARIRASSEPDKTWSILKRMDAKIKDGNHVADATMLTALIYPLCSQVLDEKGDLARKFEEVLTDLLHPMRFTKRHTAQIRQIFLAQRRLAKGPDSKRARRLLDREYAADALDLLELTSEGDEEDAILAAWLKVFAGWKRRNHHKQSRRNSPPQNRRDGSDRPRRHRRRPRRRKKPEDPSET
ncbi:MAG: polynucleotide adenylyltransferase PcnB [Deltaproteobacteria bacterium]|nr:polynucleotide adenylyltransferase PcnB [Deltaproteobacteria bacterium]